MKLETEEDLNELIKNQIEESTNLEYKDPRALIDKKEIAKDISAMANSNGGIIIYGLCQEGKNPTPSKIEWLENPQQKERIEQILQSSVTPKVDVKIRPIPNKDYPSKFVLIVEVPKSDKVPHQDHSDKDRRIYWRRNGYTTREMEYYEIEDAFFTRKKAFLEVSLIPRDLQHTSYDIVVSNKGKIIAEKIHIQLLVPKEFKINEEWIELERAHPLSDYYSAYQFFDDVMPIYPEHPSVVGRLYSPKKIDNFAGLEVGFLIVSKNSELKVGKIIHKFVSGEGYKQILEYSEDKKGVPIPRIITFWDS
ncbi:ATP-binding protein [Candidatus Pacearchaeota archaeon]|nr:ATP-binding protein [Candidatus Pacearchaeota archaeon]